MKHCPNCKSDFENSNFNFCPKCSEKGLRISLEEISDTANLDSNAQTSVPGVNVGMGTLIKAPISNTTNVYTQPLTEAEKIKKNKDYFAEECSQRCHNGFISEEDKIKLEQIREKIELERHFADDILNKVLERSIKPIVEIPIAAQEAISSADKAIISNDTDAIKSAFEKLKVWNGKIANDTFLQMYFQLSSILEPVKYIDELTDASSEYWQEFWSYIAFKCISPSKAEEVFPKLTKWDTRYPRENQLLLSAIGYLMDANDAKATELFNSIGGIGFSDDLRPIYETIDSLIGSQKNLIDTNFYKEKLFKSSYDTHRAEWLEKLAEAEALSKENKHKKESFLVSFYRTKGELFEALSITGITEATLNTWIEDDPEFHNKFADKKRLVEAEKKKEDLAVQECKKNFIKHYQSNDGNIKKTLALLNITQNLFEEWIRNDSNFSANIEKIDGELSKTRQVNKEKFLASYKSNNCKFQKACQELNLSLEIVNEWRESDVSFNNSICYIKHEYDRKRTKTIVSTVLACILIIALLVLIVSRIQDIRANKQEAIKIEQQEKELQKNVINQHDALIRSFNEAFSDVNLDDNSIDTIQKAYLILENIKSFEESHNIQVNAQYESLRLKMYDMCNSLMESYKRKKTPLDIDPKTNAETSERYRELEDKVKLLMTKL